MRPEARPEVAELAAASADLDDKLDELDAALEDGSADPRVARVRLDVIKEKRHLLKIRELVVWAQLARRCMLELLAEKGLTESSAARIVDRVVTSGTADD